MSFKFSLSDNDDNNEQEKQDEELIVPEPEELEEQLPLPKLPKTWGKPPVKAVQALRMAHNMFNTQHGLFAAVPLICNGDKCPYAKTCVAYENGVAPVGWRCAVEIMSISNKFQRYCEELQIDDSKMVNLGLVKDLISCEILIDRCDQIIAKNGLVVEDVIALVDDAGTPYYKPEVNKALELKDKYMKRKNEILQLLNSTPKDKAKTEGIGIETGSEYAANIVAQYLDFMKTQAAKGEEIEGEFTEIKEADGDEHVQ